MRTMHSPQQTVQDSSLEPYRELELWFGEWSGCENPNTVAVSSGTSALHVALESLQLRPKSRVLVPDFTMVACPRAVVMAGLEPVFVDCTSDLLMDVSLLESINVFNVSAIMPVHVYGRRCNMPVITAFANSCRLKIIEDLAEAHGVKPHHETDAACWSFYKNKIIRGEEGGIISFKNPDMVERAKSLRSLGFTPQHDFNHSPRGVNARMSNAHAQLVLHSLHAYEWNNERRRAIARIYDSILPDEWKMPKRNAIWVYDVLCPKGTDTHGLVNQLNSDGVAARLAFQPMHIQEEFRNCKLVQQDVQELAVSSQMANRVIYLPVDTNFNDDTYKKIAESLVSYFSPAG